MSDDNDREKSSVEKNQAISWLVLNNIAMVMGQTLNQQQRSDLFARLKDIHGSIENQQSFSRVFLADVIKYHSKQKRTPVGLNVGELNNLKDMIPDDEIQQFIGGLITNLQGKTSQPNNNDDVATLEKSQAMIDAAIPLAKRFENIIALVDNELQRAYQHLQKNESIYTSKNIDEKGLQFNFKLAVPTVLRDDGTGVDIIENFDGMYILESISPDVLQPGNNDAERVQELEGYINLTRGVCNGFENPISVIASVDHKINDENFEKVFQKIIDKDKKRRKVETAGLRKRFGRNNAMDSFVQKPKIIGRDNYDSEFAAIDENDKHSYNVEVVAPNEAISQKMGTLFFPQFDTPDKNPVGFSMRTKRLKQLWLLSKTQTVAIGLQDITDNKQRGQAAEIAMTFKLLDTWVEKNWTSTEGLLNQRLEILLRDNPACRNALIQAANATDKPQHNLAQSIQRICNYAYDVYTKTIAHNKQLDYSHVSVANLRPNKKGLYVDVSCLLSIQQKTCIQDYLDDKDANAETAMKKGKKGHTRDNYHEEHKPPVDKKLRMRAAQEFFDSKIDNDNEMLLRDAVQFALRLQAILIDPVFYTKRKGATLKQGKAVAAIKETYSELIGVIEKATGHTRSKAESMVWQLASCLKDANPKQANDFFQKLNFNDLAEGLLTSTASAEQKTSKSTSTKHNNDNDLTKPTAKVATTASPTTTSSTRTMHQQLLQSEVHKRKKNLPQHVSNTTAATSTTARRKGIYSALCDARLWVTPLVNLPAKAAKAPATPVTAAIIAKSFTSNLKPTSTAETISGASLNLGSDSEGKS